MLSHSRWGRRVFTAVRKEGCFVQSGLVSVPVLLSAVDEVSQGHLLVAGEVVPRRCVGEDVHRKVAVDEVSDELTADVLIHEIRV